MRLIIADTLNQTPTGQQRVELADRKPSALPIPRAVFGSSAQGRYAALCHRLGLLNEQTDYIPYTFGVRKVSRRRPFRQTRTVLPSWAMTPIGSTKLNPSAEMTRTMITASAKARF
jgi:hypothetical protein